MREIKFRAWDKEAGKMLYPPNPHLFLSCEGVVHNFQNGSILEGMLFAGVQLRRIDIYDDDVLESDKGVRAHVFYPEDHAGFFIKWKNVYQHVKRHSHYFKPLVWACRRTDWKVIGNIWENPELLKESNALK